ncbi:FtsX-like permease family protein [Halococcus agarilyticus]|uniref:FtsX-like permease family protein n=1 Tax=Halococcus agarilyticus TaxID=1232219 RepID=UPI0012AB329F|nr:FtsX-like permease family protein [Halococcus agarilyticus]
MSYTRSLLTRWSRRDRLTVLVVAVTAAFLVGSTLLLAAAGAQTATIADGLDTTTSATYHDSYAAVNATAADEVVLPTTTVARPNGSAVRFIGVPPDTRTEIADASVGWQRATIPTPNGSIQGPVTTTTRQRFRTSTGPITDEIQPHPTDESVFPAEWYVANASTVQRLGDQSTAAFVIRPGRNASGLLSVPQSGTPLLSALVFLFAGMREMLTALLAATVGSALLIVVVVYNVLRMSVRDRLETIQVIRSTGGTPRRVLALFGLRAGLIVTVGVALGFAIGVVVTNAVVNVAIYAGLPISLTPKLTPLAIGVLGVMLTVLVLAGVVAGVLAARSAATQPPARLTETGRPASDTDHIRFARLRRVLTPSLLDPRAVVPTTLTLAVFAVVVLLVLSFAGAVAPLSSPGEGTVAEADAAHVLNSRIDTEYATALRSNGIAASPEILLPQTVDGEPFLALGANYSAFASVTDATLVAGTPPNASTTNEVVVGTDLAETLGVEVGESLTLGGSFSPALTRVTVVGTYDATGVANDQLVVPLSTAHHLALRPGDVQYIRTEATDFDDRTRTSETAPRNSISVTGVSAPDVAAVNQSIPVAVRVRNLEATNATRELPVSIDNTTRSRTVTLGPDGRGAFTVPITSRTPGNHTLRVGSRSLSIRVFPANALRVPTELPAQAPPNATVFVPVVTPTEEPVANATVSIANRTTSTGGNGVVQLTLPETPGAYTITAAKGDRPTATRNVTITESADRRLSARLTVTPKTASVLERPEANVTVANPWNATISRELVLTSPVSSRTRTVTLGPGETAAVGIEVFAGSDGRASPGTYTIGLRSNGTPLARTEYTIEGDDRLFASLASTGEYSQGAGVGQAIRSVFGNVQLLFATMVVLAGLTTVGTTTATFAQVIHARRRAIGIHRATGAAPRGVLKTVLADVCLIAIPATVVAIGLAVGATRALEAVGALTVFGIRLSTATPGPVLVGLGIGAFLLAVLGAVFATVPFLARPPTRLLTDSIARLAHQYGSER